VLAIIPVRERDLVKTGGMPLLGGKALIAYTIETAKRSQTIHRIVVSTDSEAVRRVALELGAEAPFLRPAELATAGTPIERVLQHCLAWLEGSEDYHPEIVVRLEISHPFRDEGLVDRVIQTLIDQGLDTVFTAYEERHNFWKVNQEGELEPLVDERETRAGRPPVYKEVSGLVCASRADVVRSGQRLGKRVGVVPLASLHALVDTQDAVGLDLARRLL
jgi:CMP-N-acetylneuraminic acid synthetase